MKTCLQIEQQLIRKVAQHIRANLHHAHEIRAAQVAKGNLDLHVDRQLK
jgi:hypothetical protein